MKRRVLRDDGDEDRDEDRRTRPCTHQKLMNVFSADVFDAVNPYLTIYDLRRLMLCSTTTNASLKRHVTWTLSATRDMDNFVQFITNNPEICRIRWKLMNRVPPENVRNRMIEVWRSPRLIANTDPVEGQNLKTVVLVGFGSEDIIRGTIPYGVKIVCSKGYFPLLPSETTLPSSLERIEFGMGIDREIPRNFLPPGVRCVKFGKQPGVLATVLPDSIMYLSMGYHFTKDWQNSVEWLPSRLRVLRLGKRFKVPLMVDKLPPQLAVIQIADNFFTSIETVDNFFSAKVLREIDIKLSYDPVIDPALLNQNNSQTLTIFPGYKGPNGPCTFGYATDLFI